MSDDIKKPEEMKPEEKRWADEMADLFKDAVIQGKAIFIDVSASGQIISMTKRNFEDLPKRLPALLSADTNQDRTIEGREFSAAMGSIYSSNTLFGIGSSLDCKNPDSGKGPLIAEDATRGLNRLLTMLHRKEAGYGAQEHVDWMTKAYDIDKEYREPGAEQRLRKELPKIYKDSDEKLLVEHQTLVDKAALGRLPRQVLPLTAADLCRGLEASRK